MAVFADWYYCRLGFQPDMWWFNKEGTSNYNYGIGKRHRTGVKGMLPNDPIQVRIHFPAMKFSRPIQTKQGNVQGHIVGHPWRRSGISGNLLPLKAFGFIRVHSRFLYPHFMIPHSESEITPPRLAGSHALRHSIFRIQYSPFPFPPRPSTFSLKKAGPTDSPPQPRPSPSHGYKSASSPPTGAPTNPAKSGYPTHLPASGWRSYAGAHGS